MGRGHGTELRTLLTRPRNIGPGIMRINLGVELPAGLVHTPYDKYRHIFEQAIPAVNLNLGVTGHPHRLGTQTWGRSEPLRPRQTSPPNHAGVTNCAQSRLIWPNGAQKKTNGKTENIRGRPRGQVAGPTRLELATFGVTRRR